MRWAIGAALAFAVGCGEDVAGADGLAFDVDLVDACPTTEPFFFGVRSVEVQLRGDSGGAPCVAARRCVPVAFDARWDPDAIEAELRAVAQPLLATDASAADFKIIGSDAVDCSFSSEQEVFLCGVVPLSAVEAGILEVPVDCAAAATDIPVCPIEPLPDC